MKSLEKTNNQTILNQFDEPLPPWATGFAHGVFQVGAHLQTRDGRRTGNACSYGENLIPPIGKFFLIITDAGNKIQNTESELNVLFWPPVYIGEKAIGFRHQEKVND